MGIFDRMGRVISSNLNALLDRAEDDGKLLELNLEEMGEQIKTGRQEVVGAVAAEKQLRKKVSDLEAQRDTWDKRAELALKTDDEELAREALRQKKRVAGELVAAEKARADQRDTALKMKDELARMEQKLEELEMRKGTLAARAKQARAGSDELGTGGGTGAFANFRKLEARIEDREAEGTAMAEVEEALGTGQSARDLEAKFRDLERGAGGSASSGKVDVEDDLAALKKRIRV